MNSSPVLALLCSVLLLPSLSRAADPAACTPVRFADIGWTDVSLTTATAVHLLRVLGYAPSVKMLSVPVTYRALRQREVDVFTGNWMPSMKADIAPFQQDRSVETLVANLDGARYTLAVPDYVHAAGVRDVRDLVRYRHLFGGRIYGIEPGNDGNRQIHAMIDGNLYGLGGFRLVESSEVGMLAAVKRAVARREWVAFLAWEPHPMNRSLRLHYLTGADAQFGPMGGARVFTNTRAGFAAQCPNAGRLLRQMVFDIPMENDMMSDVIERGQSPQQAALRGLKQQPERLARWLAGVTTRDGRPALPVVRAWLAER